MDTRKIIEAVADGYDIDSEWDSLFRLKAVMAVEHALGIEFDTSDVQKVFNLESLEALIPHRVIKLVICDLDGTLWEGVLGEGNVNISKPYQELWSVLMDFKHRGVLLAVASKNDPCEKVPINLTHFACVRMSWDSKALQVQSILDQLHVAAESAVFLDDSPQEREAIRQAFPDMLVPELGDPRLYPSIVEGLELGLSGYTDEDKERTLLIQRDEARRQARITCNFSEADYLTSLAQVVTVERLSESNVERAAQLCQRANQFHLDLHRWTEDELLREVNYLGGIGYVIHVRDRFGDAGRVGLCLIRQGETGEYWIQALVVSCRVLGRGVEAALLSTMYGDGRQYLKMLYVPGPRNRVLYDILRALGAQEECYEDPVEPFVMLLRKVECPPYIKLTYACPRG